MPRTPGRVLLAAISLVSALWVTWVPAMAAPGVSGATTVDSSLTGTPVRSVFIRPPHATTPGKPVQVMLALHGMGGTGEDFSRELVEQADHYGWLLVAPTIDYGDWTRPEMVAR